MSQPDREPPKNTEDNKENIQAREDTEKGNVETFNSLEEWWLSMNKPKD